MTLEDFIVAVDKSTRLRDIWAAVVAYFQAKSIKRISYHHIPPPGAPDSSERKIATEGYSKEWVRRYVDEKLYLVDPVVLCTQQTTEPFFWSEVMQLRQITCPEIRYLELLEEDHGDGLGLQVFGPNGRNGYCGLGFGNTPLALAALEIREFQWVCQLGHLRYCTIIQDRLEKTPPLTAREAEVLRWVARGKSNAVIAGILGVSPHTVDAYLRRIYLKLGVVDRTHAAIRGLGIGLVNMER